MTAAAAFECEPSEAEFQKIFDGIVRLEATAPWPTRKKPQAYGAQAAGGGTFASSSPADLVRPPALGPR